MNSFRLLCALALLLSASSAVAEEAVAAATTSGVSEAVYDDELMSTTQSQPPLVALPETTTQKQLFTMPPTNHTSTETRYGSVEGFVHLIGDTPFGPVTAEIYLGIPYARPPVKQLRFEKPEAPEPFAGGRLDARQFSAACASFPPLVGEPMFSEDCLYLNVFAPPKTVRNSPNGFPVVVWIHGGGFSAGGAKLYGYKEFAANFVSRGIVVVTVQYRLGMFGFFSSGDKQMPGNLGLWDQRAALMWVQENIGAFGGDVKRVTLWGHNSGAASVGALSLSRWTRDLFTQSIEMSGSVFAGWAVSDSVVGTSRRIAKHLNCPTGPRMGRKLKSCMQTKSGEELAVAAAKLGWLRDDVNFVRMQMRLDNDFFDADLDMLLAEAPRKPTIQGINSQESMVLTLPFPGSPRNSRLVIPPQQLTLYNRDQLIEFINKTIVPEDLFGAKTDEVRAAIIAFYADRNVSADADARFYLTRYTQILSDMQFVVPTLTEVSKKAREDWPVYLYLLNYMSPRFQLPVAGVFQTYEFPYLFGFSVVGPMADFDADDRRLQQVMVLSLANFIGTGSPSTQFGVWPPVTAEHPFGFFDMRPEPVLRDNLMLDRLTFWRELTERYSAYDLIRSVDAKTRKPKNDF